MEENQKTAKDNAGKQGEDESLKEVDATKATAELESALEKEGAVLAPETPEEPREIPNILQKKYPTAEELKPEPPGAPDIPSKTSLKDIPLPPYMKGAVQGASSKNKSPAGVSQGEREIGLGSRPEVKTNQNLRIVSVAHDQRTEIDKNTGLPVIRTYAGDMNREIKAKGATLTAIVGAERERSAREKIRPKPAKPVLSPRRTALIAGTILFIVIGAGSLIIVSFLNKEEEIVPPEASLINANDRVTIAVDQEIPLTDTLADARQSARISLGEIQHFVITKDGVPAKPGEVLTLLGAPQALARNAVKLMIGVHAFDRNQPFLIVTTSFYDLSFQAMLSWEETMAETLQDFVRPAATAGEPPLLSFSDVIFKNLDVRQNVGGWPLLYTFVSKDTLIITTNTNTLNEILTRLAVSTAR